jgi:cytidine deaminase
MHGIAQTGVTPEILVAEALAARRHAYAPYSHYAVGAAVLCADGVMVHGCNVENASYGATICAERVALTAAVAQGRAAPVAIAVATRDGGSPCGVCRQVMAELGPAMLVLIGDETGHFRTTTLDALLPDRFDAASLTPPA